jgi:transcriptional regulator with XRE-family HTH domain
MSPACTICNHPRRLEIDRELAQGKSHQGLARRYGVDAQAVTRHAQNHLARQLVQAYERKELAESMNLLGRIEGILTKATNIFDRNYAKGKDGLALKALGEQRCTIELLAKIAAYLHESRAMELQASRGDYESRRREEEKEYVNMALDRLNEAEADLWEALLEKIHGERHDDIVPLQTRTGCLI